MTEAEEKPQAEGLEALYVKEKPIEVKVLGVLFKLRDITGEQFLSLSKDAMDETGRSVRPEKYLPALIKATVISPNIDVSKLNVKAYTMIGDAIQKALGLTEMIPKNL